MLPCDHARLLSLHWQAEVEGKRLHTFDVVFDCFWMHTYTFTTSSLLLLITILGDSPSSSSCLQYSVTCSWHVVRNLYRREYSERTLWCGPSTGTLLEVITVHVYQWSCCLKHKASIQRSVLHQHQAVICTLTVDHLYWELWCCLDSKMFFFFSYSDSYYWIMFSGYPFYILVPPSPLK